MPVTLAKEPGGEAVNAERPLMLQKAPIGQATSFVWPEVGQ